MPEVRRYLRWYDPQTDEFVGEVTLHCSLADLQRLFGVPPSELMFVCWPVRASHADALRQMTMAPLDLKAFDYFVEADGDKPIA